MYNDIQEADGDLKKLEDVVRDVNKEELCATTDHQQILIISLIEKVIEKKDKDREDLAKFLYALAMDNKNIEWDTM